MAKVKKQKPHRLPQGGLVKTPNHHQPPEQPRDHVGQFAPVDKSQCGPVEYVEPHPRRQPPEPSTENLF